MLYIFYNSLSKSGKCQRKMYDIVSDAIKVFLQPEVKIFDIIKIKDSQNLVSQMDIEKDIVLLIGGDGTLTNITNKIYNIKPLPKIYAYKAGTGNDFLRSLKIKQDVQIIHKKYYLISPYITNLPTIKFKNDQDEWSFLNGIGFGIDAVIAKKVNDEKMLKNKSSFAKVTINAFKTFKTIPLIKINVDGKELEFKNVWLASIMNNCYVGGGMKLAPNCNNTDKLNLIIINNVSKWKLAWLFFSVYSGKHLRYKKYVHEIQGYKFSMECKEMHFMQLDGETFDIENKIYINKKRIN